MKRILQTPSRTNSAIAIALSVGVFLGLLVNDLPYLSLVKTFSLGELSQLILAIIVALYIPFYLERSINNKRVEKDLLIAGFKSLEDGIEEQGVLLLNHVTSSRRMTRKDGNKIILLVRKTSNSLMRLTEGCEEYKDKEDFADILISLRENQTQYYEDLTVNLRNTIPKISSASYIRTEENADLYLGNLLKVRMFLNSL